MNKIPSLLFSLVSVSCFMIFSSHLQASDCCGSLDIAVDARVAYYHPSSSKVRRIYGDGWADYQLEISKEIGSEWRVWAGVSGFSRKGDSIGFHDKTRLQLLPISLGLKYDYPFTCNLDVFVGGAASYSFLRIHDHSEYVREHTRKQNWGGVVQSGLNYRFSDWGVVSLFADYFFQRFRFHDSHRHSSLYFSNDNDGHRFVERFSLDMSGYKVGVGLGATF